MQMGYLIECSTVVCQQPGWASNIVDLVTNHCDPEGWLLCSHCHNRTGYVTKSFDLQEGNGDKWEPVIRGIIRIPTEIETYSPFVFLVSYGPTDPVVNYWFCYYKDTRAQQGGRLKLGHGPGGPPVLDGEQILAVIQDMLRKDLINPEEVRRLVA
jgi:hypothetical protein